MSDGSVLEHRMIMADHLGHSLPSGATVHHRNGDRLNNNIENLELRISHHGQGQKIQDLIDWLAQTHRPEIERALRRN
jgi:hypothetical protein